MSGVGRINDRPWLEPVSSEPSEPSNGLPQDPARPKNFGTRGDKQRRTAKSLNPFAGLHRPSVKGQTIAALKNRFIGDIIGWGIILPAIVSISGLLTGMDKGWKTRTTGIEPAEVLKNMRDMGVEMAIDRALIASRIFMFTSLMAPAIGVLIGWSGSPPPPGQQIPGARSRAPGDRRLLTRFTEAVFPG